MILDGDVNLPLFPSCEEQASQLVFKQKLSMSVKISLYYVPFLCSVLYFSIKQLFQASNVVTLGAGDWMTAPSFQAVSVHTTQAETEKILRVSGWC